MKLIINGREYEAEVKPGQVTIGGQTFKTGVHRENSQVVVRVGDKPFKIEMKGNSVLVDGQAYVVEVAKEPAAGGAPAPEPKKPAAQPQVTVAGNAVRAHMPGQVVAIRVKEGDSVTADTVVLVIEAMKMENEIRAGRAGVVKSIPVSVGSSVNQGDVLVVLD